jgi:hypothetical protein
VNQHDDVQREIVADDQGAADFQWRETGTFLIFLAEGADLRRNSETSRFYDLFKSETYT